MKKILLIAALMTIATTGTLQAQMQILGHWDFGETFDVVVKDTILYVGAGEQVRIYDISTQQKLLDLSSRQTDTAWAVRFDAGTYKEGTQPIKILHTGGLIGGYFMGGIHIDGNYLYVANERYFVIADISNPQDAVILSSISLPGGRDVMVKGNYAYVPVEGAGKVVVVDISNKTNPVIVQNVTGFTSPTGMDISGNYLYIGDNARLTILDLTVPSNPAVAGQIAGGISIYTSIAVNGNYAYVTDYHYGLHVFDISNPIFPFQVDSILGSQNTYNYNKVKLFGNYAFVSERYQGFDIIDISNPLNISIVNHMDVLPGYEEDLFVSALPYGNYTFLSTNTGGLGIINIDNVTNPVQEGWLITPAGGDAIDVKGNYAYIGGHNIGVSVVDISDPNNTALKAVIANIGRTTGVKVHGNYLYMTGGWAGLEVADISDPLNPILLWNDKIIDTWGPVLIDSIYLYNLYPENYPSSGGLIIYDISDPVLPSIIYNGQININNPFDAGFNPVKYGNNYLVGGGTNGLYIVDISDKTNPIIVGSYPMSLACTGYSGDLKIAGNIVYTGSGNNLVAFDISNVTNPVLLGSKQVNGPYGIVVLGTTAYVFPTYSSDRFEAVDVSNQANMIIMDSLEIGGDGYESDIVESNGLLYTNTGYIIFPGNITSIPTLPKEITNTVIVYPNPASGKINVQIPQHFGKIKTMEITNCIGQLQSIQSDNFSDIDISSLTSGLYFIVLTNFENARLTKEIIKE